MRGGGHEGSKRRSEDKKQKEKENDNVREGALELKAGGGWGGVKGLVSWMRMMIVNRGD